MPGNCCFRANVMDVEEQRLTKKGGNLEPGRANKGESRQVLDRDTGLGCM